MGIISVIWGTFMIVTLCLQQQYPASQTNINYAPLTLGCLLIYAWSYWVISARKWFKGAVLKEIALEQLWMGFSNSESSNPSMFGVPSTISENPLQYLENDEAM